MLTHTKSWLIVKEEHQEIAEELFLHSKVQITTEGRRHPGAVTGSTVYKQKKYMREDKNTVYGSMSC